MTLPLFGMRGTGWRLALTLCLACVLAPAASARQQSSGGDDAVPKPATTAKSASTAKPATTAKSASTAKPTTAKPATKATNTTTSGAHQNPAAKPSTSAAATSTSTTHASSSKHSSRRRRTVRARGQQKIDSERARTIQQALIREHYLTGEPTGTWNQASEDAMRRYQADHGWQTKEVPDSRALIKLGLGPDKDHLLNPESAMTTGPDAPKSNPAAPTANVPTPAPATPSPLPTQNDSPSPQ